MLRQLYLFKWLSFKIELLSAPEVEQRYEVKTADEFTALGLSALTSAASKIDHKNFTYF